MTADAKNFQTSTHDVFTGNVVDGKAVFNLAGQTGASFSLDRKCLDEWYEAAANPDLKHEIARAQGALEVHAANKI